MICEGRGNRESVLKSFIDKVSAVFDSYCFVIFLSLFALLILLAFFVYRLKTENKRINFYLDIVRTLSKVLSKKYELIIFDNQDEIIFATHPNFYQNKKEAINSINSRIVASAELKSICDMLLARKPFETILRGEYSNNQRQKKLDAEVVYVGEDESFVGSELSIFSMADVSKFVDENEKIAKNYDQLEHFLDTFPFGIFYVNNRGIITGANTTFANMLRTSRDKIIGETIKDFIPDFCYDIPNQKMNIVSIKPKFAGEFQAILVKSSVSSFSSMQPWIIYKQEHWQTKPEEKKSFLEEGAFASAPIPSVIVDISGKIKALNPAFGTMIQDKVILEKNKIMKQGASILDFIIPDNDSENVFIGKLQEAFESSKIPSPIEIKFIGGNITAMAYINRIENTNADEKLLLLQMIDISGQKALEQQFIQSQKMQAVGQLAGGIAHDFNNLLTAMIGFCDLLLQRYTQNDPSYGDVVQIKQNAARAANLVRQLLAFSRQQALKPRVLSLTEILVELSSLLKRLIGANIEFQVVHGRDLWPIKADHGQLEQVIINLAVNARDAMPNGGKLTIKTRNFFSDKEFKCIYDTAHSGDYVLIEVLDTGCGIDPSIVENIFEPFFSRKGDLAKKSGSGTGLGLSTVYGIINQTGGFINVESELGRGTKFQIFLPRYNGPESLENPENETVFKDLSGKETILLVEDETAVRMFSARALRSKGYTILEASCAEEALQIAESEKFDLLVTDVVMPKMDGPTLNRKLREKIKDLKTIFISGYTEDTFRQDLDKDSKIHFLQKPFSLRDLASKVKEVLMNG